jgi:hypothetical protein
MEKFGYFKFRIYQKDIDNWQYEIFDENDKVLRHSEENYRFQGIARFAAIGHITLLEQQKG